MTIENIHAEFLRPEQKQQLWKRGSVEINESQAYPAMASDYWTVFFSVSRIPNWHNMWSKHTTKIFVTTSVKPLVEEILGLLLTDARVHADYLQTMQADAAHLLGLTQENNNAYVLFLHPALVVDDKLVPYLLIDGMKSDDYDYVRKLISKHARQFNTQRIKAKLLKKPANSSTYKAVDASTRPC